MSGSRATKCLGSQVNSGEEVRRLGCHTVEHRHFLTPTHPQWAGLTKECGIVS